jgi:lipoprotein NlpD
MTVHAAAAGKVIFAGTEPERFGQLIVIDHGGGWVTAYAYLGKVSVKEGQTVPARAVVARIGASGEAVKPMLHFELRRDNAPRDPLPYLPVRL